MTKDNAALTATAVARTGPISAGDDMGRLARAGLIAFFLAFCAVLAWALWLLLDDARHQLPMTKSICFADRACAHTAPSQTLVPMTVTVLQLVPMDSHCFLGIFCWNDNEPSVGGGEFHPAEEPQPRKVTPEHHCPPFSSPDWTWDCKESSGYGKEPYGVEPGPAKTQAHPFWEAPPDHVPNMDGYGPNDAAKDRQSDALRTYCKDFPNSPDCH
jgi:hypothetical protein